MMGTARLPLLFGGMCGGSGGGMVLGFAYVWQAGLNLSVPPQPP